VATVSQILSALEAEYTELKFLPTQAAGGANYLKSIRSARFWPTGGIFTTNAAQYLALPSVGWHRFTGDEGLRGRRTQDCGETAEPGVVRPAS
jgi:2-keto-3-deoxy-6-phosphogluconate aldolase